MPWKVLVSAPYMQPVIDDFRQLLEAADPEIEVMVPTVKERLSEDELLGIISNVDGVICGDDEFTERVLESALKLKVISKWGTGIDSINQETAARLGIAVCNTPDAFTQAVADTVLGYILCFARQLPWMDRDIRADNWSKRPGFTLGESTLGVIGVGNIGRAIIRRAKAFNMTLTATDIKPVPDSFLRETGVKILSKQELIESADFITLNCDLNPGNHHMIGKPELMSMKSTAYLINAARGPLIDEPALVQALKSEEIAGAALDVFESEPIPLINELLKLDNCLLAPHNANSSPEAYQRVHENTINNLLTHLKAATESSQS